MGVGGEEICSARTTVCPGHCASLMEDNTMLWDTAKVQANTLKDFLEKVPGECEQPSTEKLESIKALAAEISEARKRSMRISE